MTGARISVVIPVFNTERYLGQAIESVLAQGEQPLEILVVDDGSTDGSAAVAERFGKPVHVLRQANAGPAAARNRGLEAARGEYIAFLDADDLYSADKFAKQAKRLDCHPEIDVVIGQKSFLRLDGTANGTPHLSEYKDDHLTLQFGACLFRREVFVRIGLMDTAMQFCEDWDWFMRVREAGVSLLLHRDVVLHQRLHMANITRQREVGAQFILEMARRSLARRRHGTGPATSLPPLSSFMEHDGGPV